MSILARRSASPDQSVQSVQTWGPEPIGANQVEALMARRGADLAGMSYPNPAGWGLSGSQETTDQTVWLSPQAFNGMAGLTAQSVLTLGGATPIGYQQDASAAQIVLPVAGGM